MDEWRHLFVDGEFAERSKIVSGLTLAEVTRRASPQSHTIYEELWHTARWQRIVVDRDDALYENWRKGEVYPTAAPTAQAEWDALVADFLGGVGRALAWTASPEKLNAEVDPGSTMADALHSLAVHNSHHLGKILAMRQALGAWPPGGGAADATEEAGN